MKTNHTPTALQQAFAELPFDAADEAEVKGLLFVEQILQLMKQQGIKRGQLAQLMGVQNSRVTAMLKGTSNFTLETMIRAARAVGASLEQAVVPAGHQVRWQMYQEDEIDASFRTFEKLTTSTLFDLQSDEIAQTDPADAA
jgi:plasmid maintenance system antidote protein VapI